MADLAGNGMLPAGAAAFGLLALGAAAMAMRRRTRRREDAEFEARQQALAAIDEQPHAPDLDRGPAFAPRHDPASAGNNRSDFMLRRAEQPTNHPVESDSMH